MHSTSFAFFALEHLYKISLHRPPFKVTPSKDLGWDAMQVPVYFGGDVGRWETSCRSQVISLEPHERFPNMLQSSKQQPFGLLLDDVLKFHHLCFMQTLSPRLLH